MPPSNASAAGAASSNSSGHSSPRGQKDAAANESIAHEWDTLGLMWQQLKTEAQSKDDELDQILAKLAKNPDEKFRSGPEQWRALNEAQQRLGYRLDEPFLSAEYRDLIRIAKARKLPAIEEREKSEEVIFSKELPPDPTERQTIIKTRRAAYLSLLYAVQASFIRRRHEDRLRADTSNNLTWLGVWLLVLALSPIVGFAVYGSWIGIDYSQPLIGFALLNAAVFGLLGAFFSRLLRFQTRQDVFGFDEVMLVYRTPLLVSRLLFGMMGAVVFYVLLHSKLIGGSPFPEMDKISIVKLELLAGERLEERPILSSLSVLAPGLELAKLMVWSFIAGFSERLVPDALEQTAARARPTTNNPS